MQGSKQAFTNVIASCSHLWNCNCSTASDLQSEINSIGNNTVWFRNFLLALYMFCLIFSNKVYWHIG